jgi:Ca2+-binding EF-hand superfamily protein
MLLAKYKAAIKSYGAVGYIGLQRKFRIIDDDGTGSLNLAEFKKSAREMNISLSDAELRMLFDHFDSNRSGSIDFEEFIQGVRDPLSDRRLKLVKLAFSKLDKDGDGVIDGEEIASLYDASKHPDVLSGRMTARDVLNQFLETFDVGGVVDGKVTRDEFVNYYNNLGASIDNEDYFELMIRNAWHISGGEGAAANSANKRVLVTRTDGSQYVEEVKDDLGLKQGDKAGLIARLRAQGADVKSISLLDSAGDDTAAAFSKLHTRYGSNKEHNMEPSAMRQLMLTSSIDIGASASKALTPAALRNKKSFDAGNKVSAYGLQLIIAKLKAEIRTRGVIGFIGLQRKFRIMDDDGSKSINLAEFKKAMKEMNMGLSDAELRMLFDHFDTNHNSNIDFEEFIQGVRDPLTDRRLKLVTLAFSKLDRDGDGVVDGAEIASLYDASMHPDVLSGRKSTQDVLTQFLETFDVGGVVDGKVTRDEFINYYANLGASIDNEDYFELMIRNTWHISGGEGAAANSANKRVLVTRTDGSQYVEEVKDDLGLKQGDKAGLLARLRAQGVDAQSVSLFDGEQEMTGKAPGAKPPKFSHNAFQSSINLTHSADKPQNTQSSLSSQVSAW